MIRRAHDARDDLPIYVINLDSRPDRWRLQSLQARAHRLHIQRFPAKDAVEGRRRFPNSTLTDGATGIWHSFDSLVSRLTDEGVRAAVVLEDDAVLTPGFISKALNIRDSAPPNVALVQLGFLGDSSWRPQNSTLQNLKKILRPKSRGRALMARIKGSAADPLGLRAGMHAVLIFPDRLSEMLPPLRPEVPNTLPLDNALVAASKEFPDRLVRVRKSLAFQLPVRSDIAWGRRNHPQTFKG